MLKVSISILLVSNVRSTHLYYRPASDRRACHA